MNIFPYELLRAAAIITAFLSVFVFIYFYHFRLSDNKRNKKIRKQLLYIEAAIFVILLLIGIFAGKATTGHLSVPFFGNTKGPFEFGPELPLLSAAKFFFNVNSFEKTADIAYDPANVPKPIMRKNPENLTFNLEAKEVLAEIDNGTTYNYWTFNSTVPGPFLRARVNDTITINFKNAMQSLHGHSLDFHAATGPGGGAKILNVKPGDTRSLTFKALNPGLYIYHCASEHSVAAHSAHGQYGMILIEPEDGLPKVDREFYIVQGEIYSRGDIGDKGLVAFDSRAMLDENPNYVVLNGRVGGINNKMNANVGEKVRIFFGNGGVSKISSFHVIGEIFDNVYPEGAIASDAISEESVKNMLHKNVQSTLVPAGGSTIVEFMLDYPGKYVLVDHALARMDKGAYGIMNVAGKEDSEILRENK